MRMSRTLSTYSLREVLQYSALGLIAITLVFISRNLLRFLDDLIAVGFHLSDLLALLRCLSAMLVSYTLPVAFLFGVLLAVGRMSSDLEITAMRTCGVGLRATIVPVAALGFVISCVTWYLMLEVEHRAHRELRAVVHSMAARGTRIEPGKFHRIGQRVLYVKDRDSQDRLKEVLISDRSHPSRPYLIFAEYGRLSWDEERGEIRFQLQNGDIHVAPAGDSGDRYKRISFLTFDYAFGARQLLGVEFSRLFPREMTMEELRGIVARARAGDRLDDVRRKNPVEYLLQIHRRFALPVAPTLFALIGVPLGLGRRRGARSRGALMCALLAFAYYAILTFSQFLALQGVLSAAVALWVPNATFAAMAAVLLARARRTGS